MPTELSTEDLARRLEELEQWRKDVDPTLCILVKNVPKESRIEAMTRWVKKTLSLDNEIHDDAKRKELKKKIEHLESLCAQFQTQLAQEQRASSQHKQANTELQQDVEILQQEKNTANARCAMLEKRLNELAAEFSTKLDSQKRQYEQELAAMLAKHKSQSIRDAVPARIEMMLDSLEPAVRAVVGKYFDCEHVHVFLIQCGQFSLISQCFEACKRDIQQQGQASPSMFAFLCTLVELYNTAVPQAKAHCIIPDSEAVFDFDTHQRVGADGSSVAHVLAPALVNPAGKILHKALVILQ